MPGVLGSELHGPDCSQAKQIVFRRDEREVHDLWGGRKPICWIKLWQRELLCDQHDLVGERCFPQRRCGRGQPLGQVGGEPNLALGIEQQRFPG